MSRNVRFFGSNVAGHPTRPRRSSPARAAAITVIALVVTPIFVVNAFRVLADDWFVRHELERSGFPPDRYGLTTPQRLDLALTGLRSIQAGRPRDRSAPSKRPYPTVLPAFDSRELRHMADVRSRLRAAYRAQLGVLGAPRRSLRLPSSAPPRWRTVVPRGLLFGSSPPSASRCSQVPVILLGFDGFFLRFHEVFFNGNSWRFSDTDTLLRIYPEAFWQDTAKLAAGIVVAQAVSVEPHLAGGGCGASGHAPSRTEAGRDPARSAGTDGVLRIGHRGGRDACSGEHVAFVPGSGGGWGGPDRVRRARPVGGPLVLAHSDRLDEVSHGAASGRVRGLSLEALREVAPELPTFDEALAFFVDEAPGVGLHIDLKLRTRLDELGAAIGRHGLEARTVVSGVHLPSLHAVARAAPRVRVGITYPEDQPLDLPQALSVADGVARARFDACLGAAPPAAARAPCGSECRDAATPARDRVVGRAGPRHQDCRCSPGRSTTPPT